MQWRSAAFMNLCATCRLLRNSKVTLYAKFRTFQV